MPIRIVKDKNTSTNRTTPNRPQNSQGGGLGNIAAFFTITTQFI